MTRYICPHVIAGLGWSRLQPAGDPSTPRLRRSVQDRGGAGSGGCAQDIGSPPEAGEASKTPPPRPERRLGTGVRRRVILGAEAAKRASTAVSPSERRRRSAGAEGSPSALAVRGAAATIPDDSFCKKAITGDIYVARSRLVAGFLQQAGFGRHIRRPEPFRYPLPAGVLRLRASGAPLRMPRGRRPLAGASALAAQGSAARSASRRPAPGALRPMSS